MPPKFRAGLNVGIPPSSSLDRASPSLTPINPVSRRAEQFTGSQGSRVSEPIGWQVQPAGASVRWCKSIRDDPLNQDYETRVLRHDQATRLTYHQASINAHGKPLTEETLNAAKAADAVLLGAIGGPEWGPSSPVRPEQGLLALRKELSTYGNLRPCSFASDSLVERSPLKAEVCRGTDFVVVRELTGGIYFGDRKEDDGSGFAMDTEPYSKAEIERIARLSAHLALAQNPPAKVWSLDKANVLATSRLWRKTVTELFKNEFPQLQLEHQLIDSAAMLMVKSPRTLNGIVMTSNLFGDIISDEASVIPGSLGLLPSASLGGLPDGKSKCNGIYEPIHGKLTHFEMSSSGLRRNLELTNPTTS